MRVWGRDKCGLVQAGGRRCVEDEFAGMREEVQ